MFENLFAAIRNLLGIPVEARYGVNYRGAEINGDTLTVRYGSEGCHSIERRTADSDVVVYGSTGKIVDALPANRNTTVRYSRV